MFVRKKKNPSGVISVQIIDKSRGRYKVLQTIGHSSDALEVEYLCQQDKKWISVHCGDYDMFAVAEKEQEEMQVIEYFLSNEENILLNGTQLILLIRFFVL